MFDEETQRALMQEFFSENREALDRIEQGLLQLEGMPSNQPLLHAIFRDMHTVKGNCRMMEFIRSEELAHTAESLLEHMRSGRLRIDQEIGSLLLQVLDGLRRALQIIEQSGAEGEIQFTGLLRQLERIIARAESMETVVEEGAGEPEGEAAEELLLPGGRGGEAEAVAGRSDSIRLSIERLDALLNHVGELGAGFNQLKYALSRQPTQIEPAMEGLGQQIQTLQDEVLRYRLQPIGPVWETFHRLVRDLAVQTKKKVLLELHGEETEVDRNALIVVKEIMGHLLRNAIDHGIELPEQRIESGKSPVGRIHLSAEQRQGQIYLEIADDGRGIDVQKVRAKAIGSGLLTEDRAWELQEAEIFRLILLPGFSTAEQVSKISGRGTGMDVVQTAVEQLGGTISISSVLGSGSRFRLRIPQTMAIVPVLLVRAWGENFALPQSGIVELLSYHGAEVAEHVQGKMGAPMLRVREHLFPLVVLAQVLAWGEKKEDPGELTEQLRGWPALHVVVVQSEEQIFAVAVEQILEPANLVIKPVGSLFSGIHVLAGTTVLPDGSVAFLLNVAELLQS
ncbi:chemotaxis protein CheA [Candidatus Magnetaquicoccus inordinatus]|uniref:chemotaxis protein CheA n=1 Tax=Candidatus Magnetaquicoccus inordinatus TaxID=2496818 RepID=UPI00102BB14B|nr:chemotaxis protein CheA [Candidatus Magnetaquicoccus inordinatus]